MIRLIAFTQESNEFTELDIDQESGLQITKSASDIEDFTNRTGGFTFSFDLPFTEANNNFFEHYYEVTQTLGDNAEFNAFLRTRVEVYDAGLRILNGYLQLNDVKYVGRSYSVTCFDTVGLIAEALGNKKLEDLSQEFNDFYTHEFNAQQIIDSRQTGPGVQLIGGSRTQGVKYPFVDYGDAFNQGSIANNQSPPILDTDFRPWWNVKLLFFQILKEAGFTNIQSTFLNSMPFERLYMSSKLKRAGADTVVEQQRFLTAILSQSQNNTDSNIANYEFFLDFSFNNGATLPGTTIKQREIGSTNLGTNTFDVVFAGTYTFRWNFEHKRIGSMAVTWPDFSQLSVANQNGQSFILDAIFTQGPDIDLPDNITHSGEASVYLPTGTYQLYYFCYKKQSQFPFQFLPTGFRVDAFGSFFQMTASPQIASGGFITPAANLPDMTQIDFLRGIVQNFNLFIEPDENSLSIEPYDVYIEQGETKDWTDKLDLNKEVVIQPTYNYRKKKLGLKYTDDEDYFTNWRVERVGDRASLGSKWIDDDSDFADGESITELPFGAPPLYNIPKGNSSGLSKPTYLLQIREDGKVQRGDYLPRLGFVQSRLTNVTDASQAQLTFLNAATQQFETFSYDYVDIVEHTTFVDFTFNRQSNWGGKASIPRSMNQDPNVSTGNLTQKHAVGDSYTRHYERYIRELYGDNARLVTAYFNLTPLDFNQIRFNNLIFVKDTYYRINKVEGYTPGERKTTKVELIKLDPFGQIDRRCELTVDNIDLSGLITWRDKFGNLTTQTTRACCSAEGGIFVEGECYFGLIDTPDPGEGTPFIPPGQQEITGACCYTDEEGDKCAIVTQEVCDFLQGDFKGLGTDCTACQPPPEPTGSCCLPDGECVDGLTQEECENQAGTWFEGGDCTTTEC